MVWQFLCLIFHLFFSLTFGTNVHEQCQFDIDAAKQAAKSTSEFSWKLFSKLSKPDENLIYSPVSISLALALVQSGTSGATLTELQQHLNPPGSNQSDHSHLYASLQRQLQVKGGDKLTLNIANGFFYSQDLTVKQEFINRTKQCFDTQVEKVQFKTNSEEARRHVNQWISDKTAQKIPELFKQGTISSQTVAVLANALYFKGAWERPFSERNQNLPFYKFGGDQPKMVSFMIAQGKYGYAENDRFQLVSIPYESKTPHDFVDGFFMYVVLPNVSRQGQDIMNGSMEITMANREEIRNLLSNMTMQEVSLKIPKFTIRSSINLKDILKQMGINKIFSEDADFSRLSDQRLTVSSAVHEAYIKVDEYGTEAAAASGMRFPASAPRIVKEFTADHPFNFVIVHRPTMATVFVGKVVKVDQDRDID